MKMLHYSLLLSAVMLLTACDDKIATVAPTTPAPSTVAAVPSTAVNSDLTGVSQYLEK